MSYALGPVKPWVQDAANKVGAMYDVDTIYGVAARSTASEHPLGLALDYMVYGDKAKGDAIANHMQANAGKYSVLYIIWQQQIWSTERDSEGWRDMDDRGSVTANHRDHVHVSFRADGGTSYVGKVLTVSGALGGAIGGVVGGAAAEINPLQPAIDVIQWLTGDGNLARLGLIALGAVLLIVALIYYGFANARKVIA